MEKGELGQYYFRVNLDANKIEIRKAVEKRFGVTVESVRTVNVGGKVKRMGLHSGRRASWKKAVVTLKKGDKIELVEGL
jgi:large subunit ribosomal protein L23